VLGDGYQLGSTAPEHLGETMEHRRGRRAFTQAVLAHRVVRHADLSRNVAQAGRHYL